MKIGFTYDLRDDYIKKGFSVVEAAEFDTVETIEGIEDALNKLGHEVERIGNAENLVRELVNGKRWDMVFNIAEGVSGIGREAQVPAILDLYNIPYVFSDPMVLYLTLHKGMTTRVVRDGGVLTPDFHIVYSEDDIEEVRLTYPLFVKPVSEGTGKGIGKMSKVDDEYGLRDACVYLLKEFGQPVLVERYLPGREFTVGITGTGKRARVTGVIEINFLAESESEAYGIVNKKNYEKMMKYTVPEEEIYEKCEETALKVWRLLECRDGGRVDLRNNESGEPEFIEVNPLAGLNPIDSDLPILSRLNGLDYDGLIKEIMDSAAKRLKDEKAQ